MSAPIGSNRVGFFCFLAVFTVGLLSTSACTSDKLDPRLQTRRPL